MILPLSKGTTVTALFGCPLALFPGHIFKLKSGGKKYGLEAIGYVLVRMH